MLGKEIEFWAVVAGMAFYAAARDAEKEAPLKRISKTAASAFLAYGLADGVAPYLNNSPTFAAVLIMGFGLIILDVGTALLMDRDLIKDLVRRKFGGKNE
jgi:hypothetical protein